MISEQALIDATRAALPEALRNKYNDDDLTIIYDIVWDYYEEKGLLDIDAEDDEDDLDIDDLMAYTRNMLKKDKGNTIDLNDVEALVNAEMAAEDALYENDDEIELD
ncbi:MAG: hypothetical protein K2O12_05475 [Muribaculaceae bacterium]|nr:hypothetical protein [Muribaculaceae bacterium]